MSSKRLSPRCSVILPGWRSLCGSQLPNLAFYQPHLTGHLLSCPLTPHAGGVSHAHGTGGYLHFDRLLLGARLLAAFGHECRLDTRKFPHLSAGLSQIARLSLSLPILKADEPFHMIDPTDQVLLRLPDRAPHGHIIKATIEQPGDRLALFERGQGLADRRERLLDFSRFAHK